MYPKLFAVTLLVQSVGWAFSGRDWRHPVRGARCLFRADPAAFRRAICSTWGGPEAHAARRCTHLWLRHPFYASSSAAWVASLLP